MKPDFLIIGAMKCGTTTLFRDLSKHPAIFAPGNKEPEVLAQARTADEYEAEYAELFAAAASHQIKGEASTAYTKQPDISGVAQRALDLCGPELKLIYLRREPVARITSHYRHAREHGTITADFSEALRTHHELIDYTRYDWQLAPWRDLFPAQSMMVLDLEDYSANRATRVNEVLQFLGLDPAQMPAVDVNERANTAGEAKAIANPLLRKMVYSDLYQNRIKTLFPYELRARVRKAILPPPKLDELEVTPADEKFIAESLADIPVTPAEPAA